MNAFAWIAFGAIAGYTAFHLSPVDPTIGASGQALLAIAGSLVGGILGTVGFGVNPFAARIDMLSVSLAVVGAVIAVVWREESRRRRLVRAAAFESRRIE